MALFTPDFAQFFKDLARNNERDWFHTQKKRYQQSVKIPFETLVSQLIISIQEYDPSIRITAKDAILRINRDIRFSADKSPYNTYVTAFISPTGRKDKSIPGFFIRLSPEMVGIMVGCFGPDKQQLEQIRTAILAQPVDWQSAIGSDAFQSCFKGILGDQHKRLASPFKEHLDQYPMLANKQFYALAERPPDLLLTDELMDTLMAHYRAARPFNQFLLNAIQK